MRARASIICFVMCLSTVLRAQVGLSPDEQKLLNLVNHERKEQGLPVLQWNYHLAESARVHTQMMAQRNVLTHQFPGEPALGDRVGATGVRFNGAAENVAQGDIGGDTVASLHSSLMNSPEHRDNILSTKYDAVGMAVISRDGQMYVTEDFAHTLPTYSEDQFRKAVIAAFNKARQNSNLPAVTLVSNAQIHNLACSEYDKPQVPSDLSAAQDVVVFTSSEPEKLPSDMQKAVVDPSLHRMSLGVCFRPDSQHGSANFWLIAAFYP